MASLPAVNPYQPIPNGPFSYPQTWYINSALGPLITGAGLCVNASAGTICATGGGGGGGGVTSITAGPGLTGGTITTTGTIALETTGVSPGLYPRANVTVDPYGRITSISTSPAPGTVCSITASTGLTGGLITSNGTIAIASTGVTAGTYSHPTLTINAQGQVLSAISSTAITSLGVTNGICVTAGGANPVVASGTISLTNTGVTAGNYTVPAMTVDAQGRITAIASGSSGVTSIVTGTGLTGGPITTTGTISLSNTGVTAGSYSPASIVVDAQGRITAASVASAVTSISTGTGLTGGPITSTGTVALAPVAPSSAGTYSLANLTVDAYGRVTNASTSNLSLAVTGVAPISTSGTATTVAVSVADGTTSQKGVVTLTNDLVTNSNTTALTAAQGYSLQQQINALGSASNLTLAGTFDATTSQLLTVTAGGTAAGFTVGSNLPSPAVGNLDLFVIVTTGGSYSPPGGGGPYTASQGDWLLSNGTAWQFLNVGYDEDYATTTAPGVIQLATDAQVAAGTDATLAVTPLTLCSNYVANTCYGTQGDLLVATGAGAYSALPVSGIDGAPLVACSTDPLGVAYGSLPILQNSLLAKGDVIVASSASTPDILSVGTNGQVLTACSTETLGVKWAELPAASIPCAQITAIGSLITGSAPGVPATLASSNTNGDVLVVCTACANGLAWSTPGSFIQTCCVTGKGAIISGTAANTPVALPVGADGQVLTACALCSTGLFWSAATVPAIPCDCITGKGALVSGTAASTPTALSVGADGEVLTACSACSTGLFWSAAVVPAIPCACITGKGALVTGDAADSPVALPVGADNKVLIACSACTEGLTWGDMTPVKVVQQTASCTSNVTLATEIVTRTLTDGESLTIKNDNITSSGVNVTVTAGSLANYTTYPTQATATVFTIPPEGTVSLIANDVANDTWYIENFETPAQVASVGFRAATNSTYVNNGLTAGSILPSAGGGVTYRTMLFTADAATINPQGYYNPVTGRFAPQVAGYYSVNFRYMFRANSTSGTSGYIAIYKNGQVYAQSFDDTAAYCCPELETLVYMNGVTDYLEVGASVNVGASTPTYGVGSTEWTIEVINQTGTQVVGINGVSRMEVSAGTIPSGSAVVQIVPGVGGVTMVKNFDPQSWFNTTTGRFTPTTPGYYQVEAYVTGNSGIPNIWGGFFKNGVLVGQGINRGNDNWVTTNYNTVVYMNGTTDYLTLGAAAQAGAASFVTIGSMTGMAISLVGANTVLPLTDLVVQYPGNWINAGTIQSVGWGATTTAPTIGAAVANAVYYRQLGPKAWEVMYSFEKATNTGYTNGSGDYLFTLPASLQWDTTLPFQKVTSTLIGVNDPSWYSLAIPYSNTTLYALDTGVSQAWTRFGMLIVPFNSTQFRVINSIDDSTSMKPWGSAYYAIAVWDRIRTNFTFQITTP